MSLDARHRPGAGSATAALQGDVAAPAVGATTLTGGSLVAPAAGEPGARDDDPTLLMARAAVPPWFAGSKPTLTELDGEPPRGTFAVQGYSTAATPAASHSGVKLRRPDGSEIQYAGSGLGAGSPWLFSSPSGSGSSSGSSGRSSGGSSGSSGSGSSRSPIRYKVDPIGGPVDPNAPLTIRMIRFRPGELPGFDDVFIQVGKWHRITGVSPAALEARLVAFGEALASANIPYSAVPGIDAREHVGNSNSVYGVIARVCNLQGRYTPERAAPGLERDLSEIVLDANGP